MLDWFRKRVCPPPRLTGEDIEIWIHENKRDENGWLATLLRMAPEAEKLLRDVLSERLDRRGSEFPPLGSFEGISICLEYDVISKTVPVALEWWKDDEERFRRIELKFNS